MTSWRRHSPHAQRWKIIVAFAAVVLAVGGLAVVPASADETTIAYSPLRTGWDDAEPGLTSDSVTQSDFGQLWSTQLDDTTGDTPNQMYAQPLVADDVGGVAGNDEVIVATEDDQVAALNPKTGALQWQVSLGTPWAPDPTCGDLLPHIGITATPVYDPGDQAVYVIAKTATTDPAVAQLKIHKLSVTTGQEMTGFPVTIKGTSSDGGVAFDATTANARPGLLLMHGRVYFASASHCDHGPYVGFVGSVKTTGPANLQLWSAESGQASDEAGIWQSGGGIVSDGIGRIFVATGNGVSPAPSAKPHGTLGESVVRLAVGSGGTMTAKDFFSPANNAKLDQDDADLGSGGPIALPDDFGSGDHQHLMLVAGKDGSVWLLDRDDLGGMGQGPGGTNDVVDSTQTKGVWGRAAAFDAGSSGHFVYLLPSSSPLQAYRITPNVSDDEPTLSLAGTSSASFGYTSGSPAVTSDGDDDSAASTALVWIVVCDDSTGANGMLEAFPAVPPTSGAWQPVRTFPLGSVAKFIQPATDGGRVFVGTRDGRVVAFGRPTTAALTAPSSDLGDVPVGSSKTEDVTITANTDDVTVTGVSITGSSDFDAGSPVPDLPAELDENDTLAVPVTFTPSSATTRNGTLTVTASDDDGDGELLTHTYSFGVSGTGTAPGVAADPTNLQFGQVAAGYGSQQGVTIRNTGTDPETITSVTAPSDPAFTFVDTPLTGTQIPSLGSRTVQILFQPADTEAHSSSFTIGTDAAGNDADVTVPLTGTGFTGTPQLTYSGALVHGHTLDFGSVPPGKRRSTTVTITNTGSATMTVNKAAPPVPPFVVSDPVSEGQSLEPGDSITVTIKVAPTSAVPDHDVYSITINDGRGPQLLKLALNTAPPKGTLHWQHGCMTLDHRIFADGQPFVNYACSGTRAQQFTLDAHDRLRPVTQIGNWCAAAPGTTVVLKQCNAARSEQWSFDPAGRVVVASSGKCLASRNGGTANETPLVVEKCSSPARQQWDGTSLVSARGQVESGVGVAGQYCLTDPGNSAKVGTAVELGKCRTAPGQLIAHIGTTLRVAGQCLTAFKAHQGSAARLRPCSGAATQVWTHGTANRLYDPAAGLCLADPGSTTAAGTVLVMQSCTGKANQSWTLPDDE